jgi:hypothetical protein
MVDTRFELLVVDATLIMQLHVFDLFLKYSDWAAYYGALLPFGYD